MMKLQSLSIRRLFGQFDYDLSFNQEDGITILTGPNGYGKTTILNIIHGLFMANFGFFQALNFESISFVFSENRCLILSKGKQEQIQQNAVQVITQVRVFFNLNITLVVNGQQVEQYVYTPREERKLFQGIQRNFPMSQFAQSILQGMVKNPLAPRYAFDAEGMIFGLLRNSFSILFADNNGKVTHQHLRALLLSSSVYYIKDQRLLKQITLFGPNNKFTTPETSFAVTIKTLAKDLQEKIAAKQNEAFRVGQKLDSTFPARMLNPNGRLSKKEFDERIQKLVAKQQQLQEFGIAISPVAIPQYDEGKADVLAVYLEDSEKKAAVFDDLVAKISLFVTSLKNKQLTHKSIKIDGKTGFTIVTDDGKSIDLTLLSSGEQQEIVLLYELLFKTTSNTLILVDEPETSLHVTWQKDFIKDILAIAKMQGISFCIATHSPQIINGRWNLTTDLYTLANKEADPDYE
jgi:predicted ATP-binding protein involved in virulence